MLHLHTIIHALKTGVLAKTHNLPVIQNVYTHNLPGHFVYIPSECGMYVQPPCRVVK